jgi:hypothetical protein
VRWRFLTILVLPDCIVWLYQFNLSNYPSFSSLLGSSIHIQNEPTKQSNVDVQYLYILLHYIKQYNNYCGLCVRNITFGTTNINNRQLLRCTLRCSGRPTCELVKSLFANTPFCQWHFANSKNWQFIKNFLPIGRQGF